MTHFIGEYIAKKSNFEVWETNTVRNDESGIFSFLIKKLLTA